MKKTLIVLCCTLVLFSCGDKKDSHPGTSLETGRTFIRASLDGDFKTARELLLNDSTNLETFAAFEEYYHRLPESKKESYRNASFEINHFNEPNDSSAILNYSNSFMKQPMEIKLVRKDKEWWIDFKYTGTENPASPR